MMIEHELDAKTLELVESKFRQMEMLEHQIRGVLELYRAQHGLDGLWFYEPRTRSLVKHETVNGIPAPSQVQQPACL